MLLKFIKIEQSNKNYSYGEYIFVAAINEIQIN